MKNNFKNIPPAFGISSIFWFFVIIIFYLVPESTNSWVNRIAVALGGDALNGGYIQFLTYVAFIWGLFEITQRNKIIAYETKAFQLKLLPEDEHKVLLPDEINQLRIKVVQLEQQNQKYLLTDLLKKACTKFRANKSVSEVMDIVSRQSQLNLSEADSSQNIIRYIAWSIPSIGFIGTVLGIAGGIGKVKGNVTPETIDQVTALLKVSFDTTLIALLLSIVIMYMIHTLQAQEEYLHNKLEQYLIENFINRIYVA
jgi:chemotaxis protein MotA